jgi:prephenate dehydrogenase
VARFRQVAILGTGLIGSSLALALKTGRDAPRIVGFDLNGDSRRGAGGLKTAAGARAYDDVYGNLAQAVRGAELVVLSVPVRAIEVLLREVALVAAPGTVVTDTGSTKQQVMQWAEEILPETVQFIGGHPMAGKVNAGPWDAEATLFQETTYCLCPLPRTERAAVERLVELVESLGAAPYFVDASEHDGLVAAVSHLPYLVSAAVMNTAAGDRGWREAAGLAAGGFATATHLTESDPQMLADICLTNREAILHRLDRFSAELARLRQLVEAGDPVLKQAFAEAQDRHRLWLSGRAAEGVETPRPIDTADLRPQSLFVPARLTDLIRGKRRGDKAT